MKNGLIEVLLVIGIVAALGSEYHRGARWNVLALGLGITLVILGMWWGLFQKAGWATGAERSLDYYQQRYRRQTGRDETIVTCEFTSAGLVLVTGDGVRMERPWSSIQRAVGRPQGLLVYIGPEVFHWFPKRVFASEADFEALMQWVRARVAQFESTTANS